MRKLASIQRIKNIRPIEGADKIEVASVKGWDVVVKKGEYDENDLIVYFEIDSFLPIRDEFEFLRKSSYKKLPDGTEGFRLKTIRLRGQVSQGLVMPINILYNNNTQKFKELLEKEKNGDLIGLDVTEELSVTKYEKPIPAQLSGKVKGYLPSYIKKTDQERIQNLTEEFEEFKKYNWVITEKLDGSSATFYYKDGEFGVCSRNLELYEDENNAFWTVCRKLNIEEKLTTYCENNNVNLAIQGELIGNGVQGNKYRLNDLDVKFFSVFDIDNYYYYNPIAVDAIIHCLDLERVPILNNFFMLESHTIVDLLKMAEGKSKLNNKIEREGLVFVSSHDGNISFKAISNTFLLNEN